MGQFTPTVNVPYRLITQLPPAAQYQLWRNFEELSRSLPAASVTGYDAVIDGKTSVPSTHHYKNLTELVAGETFVVPKRVFRVLFAPDQASSIIETANIILHYPILIEGAGPTASGMATSRPVWLLNGFTLTNNTGSDITTLRNLYLNNASIGFPTTAFVDGPLILENCIIDSVELTGSHTPSPCTGPLWATNTMFIGCTFQSSAVLLDCHYVHAATTNYTLTANDLFWLGGTFSVDGAGLSVNITISASNKFLYIQGVTPGSTDVWGSLSAAQPTLIVDNSGSNWLDFAGALVHVKVTTNAGPSIITGSYGNVTLQVNTNNKLRNFIGEVGVVGDFTGPCSADISLANGASTIFRGSGIRADVGGISTTNSGIPAVALISCADSLINAAFGPNNLGKPYAIDAASLRNLLIFGGSNGGWAVAGTNASATSSVIDETGVHGAGTGSVDVTAIHRDGLWFTSALMLGGM